MTETKYTTLRFTGIFLGMFTRLFRSMLFNVIVFFVGFGVGYVTISSEVHFYAIKNNKYQCIDVLENKLKQQRILDNEIDTIINEIKMKVAHDQHKCIYSNSTNNTYCQ